MRHLRWNLQLGAAALAAASCSTADYVNEADAEVYGILEKVSLRVTGEAKAFSLDEPVGALRQQLLDIPGPLELNLQAALDVAAENSRTFRQRKEALYLTALNLTRSRFDFATQWGGGGSADTDGVGDDTADLSLSDDLSASVRSVSGLRIVGSFVNTFFRSLVGGGGFDGSSILNLTLTQPLLRGFGRNIVREPLNQAERDVVYEVRAFERFRKSLAVQITGNYFRILRLYRDLESERANYDSVKTSADRIEELFDAGRRNINDVGLAKQNLFSAENRLVVARNGLQSALDNFKLLLGLPMTAELELDTNELVQLSDLGVKPIALQEQAALDLAYARRYDYQTARDEVADAARRLLVAENALESSLDFSAAFSVPTDPNQPLDFDWSRVTWSAGFDLDLALNRLGERNAYRSALITLDVRIRARDQLEDQIRADLRASLRDIGATIESYEIQRRAVTLAERRVESQTELYNAGRAQARDVLDAQNALLDARLRLSSQLVTYLTTRLQLMLDLEALDIEPKGLRYDRSLPIPAPAPLTRGEENGS